MMKYIAKLPVFETIIVIVMIVDAISILKN